MGETTLGNLGVQVPKTTADIYGKDFYLFANDGVIDTNGTNAASDINIAALPNLQSRIDASNKSWSFGDMFNFGSSNKTTDTNDTKESGGGFGSTLQGIGAVTGALASIYGIREQKKYQDEVLGMEKERVAKNEARRDAKQAEYDKVWG